MVGDATSSHGIYFLYSLPSTHVCPLILPQIFSLIMFISPKAYFFCWYVKVSGFITTTNFMSCIYLYYLNISANAHLPNIYILFFACIWPYLKFSTICENITSAAILWKPIGQFCSISSLTLINWVSYDLPPSFIRSLLIFPTFSRVDTWMKFPTVLFWIYQFTLLGLYWSTLLDSCTFFPKFFCFLGITRHDYVLVTCTLFILVPIICVLLLCICIIVCVILFISIVINIIVTAAIFIIYGMFILCLVHLLIFLVLCVSESLGIILIYVHRVLEIILITNQSTWYPLEKWVFVGHHGSIILLS